MLHFSWQFDYLQHYHTHTVIHKYLSFLKDLYLPNVRLAVTSSTLMDLIDVRLISYFYTRSLLHFVLGLPIVDIVQTASQYIETKRQGQHAHPCLSVCSIIIYAKGRLSNTSAFVFRLNAEVI